MLRRLSVENYALIDKLEMELDPHLNIITGETGAGKIEFAHVFEKSFHALIIGGVYLMIRQIISPSTPLAFIGTVALLNLIAGNDVIYQLLSGGLLLGAFFMATDYVTTPITWKGKLEFLSAT